MIFEYFPSLSISFPSLSLSIPFPSLFLSPLSLYPFPLSLFISFPSLFLSPLSLFLFPLSLSIPFPPLSLSLSLSPLYLRKMGSMYSLFPYHLSAFSDCFTLALFLYNSICWSFFTKIIFFLS